MDAYELGVFDGFGASSTKINSYSFGRFFFKSTASVPFWLQLMA
jgi:hypothetical protein